MMASAPDQIPATRNAEGFARQRETMRGIQRRLVAHLAAGKSTDMAAAPMALDVAIFADPVRAAEEQAKLFRHLPMVVCLSCDMPEPGDMVPFDDTGVPILVVRGKDGKVRAFLNTCRHRGARLVKECTHKARITCPFHAWTYDLSGKLVGLPGKAGFEGLDQAELGLIEVPAAEWHGLVFVRAEAGGAPIDVEDYLGDMADEIRQLDLAAARPVKKTRIEVGSNWKFAQDTFFESYHFTTLHPDTIAAHAFGNVMVHDEFGPHQRVMVPQHFWQDWVGEAEEEWPYLPYQGIHLLFPNTILFVGNKESMAAGSGGSSPRQIFGVWRAFPGETPERSFAMMATYRPIEQDSEQQIADYEQLTDYIWKVIEDEDYALCRDSQRNLTTAPAGHQIYIGRNEGALQAIHRNIAEHLGADA
jgi:phenylpropionate dioxygenase-like ring-hydroxylating dioxygenase large terminal subunit